MILCAFKQPKTGTIALELLSSGKHSDGKNVNAGAMFSPGIYAAEAALADKNTADRLRI